MRVLIAHGVIRHVCAAHEMRADVSRTRTISILTAQPRRDTAGAHEPRNRERSRRINTNWLVGPLLCVQTVDSQIDNLT
jgi:hypothetical protein